MTWPRMADGMMKAWNGWLVKKESPEGDMGRGFRGGPGKGRPEVVGDRTRTRGVQCWN